MVFVTQLLTLIDEKLQACLFLLMCFGLLVATVLRFHDMIDGGEWVTVCGILFGTNAAGGAISQFGRPRVDSPVITQ